MQAAIWATVREETSGAISRSYESIMEQLLRDGRLEWMRTAPFADAQRTYARLADRAGVDATGGVPRAAGIKPHQEINANVRYGDAASPYFSIPGEDLCSPLGQARHDAFIQYDYPPIKEAISREQRGQKLIKDGTKRGGRDDGRQRAGNGRRGKG